MIVSLDVALAAMNYLSRQGREGYLDGIGVNQVLFDRFVGEDPWSSLERSQMCQVGMALTQGAAHQLGLPPFDMPAEWVAAVIATFVHPSNVYAACHYLASSGMVGVEEMGRPMSKPEAVLPQRLFALVLQLVASPQRSSARAMFEKKTGIALERAFGGVEPKKK